MRWKIGGGRSAGKCWRKGLGKGRGGKGDGRARGFKEGTGAAGRAKEYRLSGEARFRLCELTSVGSRDVCVGRRAVAGWQPRQRRREGGYSLGKAGHWDVFGRLFSGHFKGWGDFFSLRLGRQGWAQLQGMWGSREAARARPLEPRRSVTGMPGQSASWRRRRQRPPGWACCSPLPCWHPTRIQRAWAARAAVAPGVAAPAPRGASTPRRSRAAA